MIKNIIFDIGSVLVEKSYTALNKFNLSKEDFETLKNSIFIERTSLYLDKGNTTHEQYYKMIESEIPDHLKDIAYDVLNNYYKYRDFKNDMLELLIELKNNNYNIYILSNNNMKVYEYLKTTMLNDYVDGWIISAEYHTVKPNKEIYEILLNKYNLNPEECYFIDDIKENIDTAIKLGMKGFIFNDNIELLKEDLNKNNIKTD